MRKFYFFLFFGTLKPVGGLHVYEDTKDFLDNKKIDYSTIPKWAKERQGQNHHVYYHEDKNYYKNHPITQDGHHILNTINSRYGLGLNKQAIFNNTWKFSD